MNLASMGVRNIILGLDLKWVRLYLILPDTPDQHLRLQKIQATEMKRKNKQIEHLVGYKSGLIIYELG